MAKGLFAGMDETPHGRRGVSLDAAVKLGERGWHPGQGRASGGSSPPAREGKAGSVPRLAGFLGEPSEGQQDVHHLLAVARLLDIGDLTAASVSDARLSNLA